VPPARLRSTGGAIRSQASLLRSFALAAPASAATINLLGVYNDNDFPAPEIVNAIVEPDTLYLA
jgi:hypothetical protein